MKINVKDDVSSDFLSHDHISLFVCLIIKNEDKYTMARQKIACLYWKPKLQKFQLILISINVFSEIEYSDEVD